MTVVRNLLSMGAIRRQNSAVSAVLVAAVLAATAAVTVGCGSDPTAGEAAATGVIAAPTAPGSAAVAATGSTAATGGAAASAATGAVRSAAATLPAIDLLDLASGRSLALASLVAPDRPTLFWAWAPY